MNFGTAISTVFTKYVTFRGVASRSEYWWFALFTFLVGIVFNILMTITGESDSNSAGGPVTLISGLWSLAVFLPSLAVQVRRFHDAGFSGKWLLLYLVPFIGFLVTVGSSIPVILAYLKGSLTDDALATAIFGLIGIATIPFLTGLAVAIFTLIVLVRPSKSAVDGNKYAA